MTEINQANDAIIRSCRSHFDSLGSDVAPTRSDIETFIRILAQSSLYSNHDIDILKLANSVLTFYDTVINEIAPSISDPNTRTYWRQRRVESGKLKFNRWRLQEEYLKISGFPSSSIKAIDKHTDYVLDAMGDPESGDHFDYRNLVCGQIQSGKTTAYLSLINKALDSGYKTIIIFTGRTEDLRIQTNAELDRMVYGKATYLDGRILSTGVGRLLNTTFGKMNNFTHETFGVRNANSSIHIELAKSFTKSKPGGEFGQDFATRLSSGSHKIISSDPLPSLLVVKKVPSVIRNIIKAVQENGTFSSSNPNSSGPVLIIDDEIDDASINTAPREEEIEGRMESVQPTTTNRLIRKLLENIAKVSYVGYTATPFAPVLQPEESSQEIDRYGYDIYPKDGIFVLPTPSNYLGTSKIFGYWINQDGTESGLSSEEIFPGVIPATDANEWWPEENRTRGATVPDNIPDSLKDAIKDFIIAACIKDKRELKKDFHSMLIHIDIRNDNNEIIKEEVEECVKNIYERFDSYDQEKWEERYKKFIEISKKNIEYLKKVEQEQNNENPDYEKYNYDRFFGDIEYPSWGEIKEDVKELIKELNEKIDQSEIDQDMSEYESQEESVSPVKIVNADGDILPYTGKEYDVQNSPLSERCVIAVGGFKLSRGMVIKNLTVSYYLRRAKQQKADTILQMGRWFGYRDNYQDLIRLYTSNNLINDHKAACEYSEQIRFEFLDKYFEVLASQDGRIITPKDISPLLRGNPAIIPTARNKRMSALEIIPNLNGKFIETLRFEQENIQNNLSNLGSFINSLEKEPEDKLRKLDSAVGFCWKDIPYEKILDFFKPTQRNIHYKGPYNTTKAYGSEEISAYIEDQAKKGAMTNWTIGLISDDTSNNNPEEKIGLYDIAPVSRKIKTFDPNSDIEKNIAFKATSIGSWPFFDLCMDTDEIKDKRDQYKIDRGQKQKDGTYTGNGLLDPAQRRNERNPKEALLLIYLILPSNANDFEGLEIEKPLVGFGIESALLSEPIIRSRYSRINTEQLSRIGHDEWNWTEEAFPG